MTPISRLWAKLDEAGAIDVEGAPFDLYRVEFAAFDGPAQDPQRVAGDADKTQASLIAGLSQAFQRAALGHDLRPVVGADAVQLIDVDGVKPEVSEAAFEIVEGAVAGAGQRLAGDVHVVSIRRLRQRAADEQFAALVDAPGLDEVDAEGEGGEQGFFAGAVGGQVRSADADFGDQESGPAQPSLLSLLSLSRLRRAGVIRRV